MSSVEEAIKEIENYLDYEGSVSIQAIATLYTLYNKEKEKNNEWRLKIKEKLWELDKNEHERINKIKNPNEMFPNLIYISNKKILEQLLKEGEGNV